MKLIYLWIEKYQYIEKQGYLLDAGYQVEYDSEKNKLSVSEKGSIDCLLYGDKISVTAIVGDNGAGKSTLLDAIRSVLFDKESRGKEIKGFLVWENAGELNLFPFMKKQPDAGSEVSVSECLSNDFNLIYFSDFLDEKYYLKEFDDGKDGYTYIEEQESSFRNRNSVQLNISTSYLLRASDGSVLDFFHSDTKRQINFYGGLQRTSQPLPFPAPASLFVKIEFLGIDLFDRILDASLQAYEYMGMGHHGEINTKAYVIGLLKEMNESYQEKTIPNVKPLETIQILQWDIFSDYIYNLLAMRKRAHKKNHNYNQIDERIKRIISTKVNKDNIWEELEKVFLRDSTEEESFKIYLDFYHKLTKMLKYSRNGDFCVNFSIPDFMMQILRDINPLSYVFPIWQENPSPYVDDFGDKFPEKYIDKNGWNENLDRDMFMDLYDSYTKISPEIDFLKCSWGMSSGENSMFTLFARLYEAMQKAEKEKVILIFDELDSSFHPQWQQKIIHSLMQFLRESYPRKEFQMILTTHSPVLLSDIPKENVIFMRKENSVETEHAQTFAANIASLYYDSFFMDKGSVGEVARGSIVHLMETFSELEEEERENGKLEEGRGYRLLDRFLRKQYPNKENYMVRKRIAANEEWNLKLLQTFIDNIGEDIWRYKANERFHHFLKGNEVDRKEEIRNHLRKWEQEEGRASVRTLLEQWLKEGER